MSDSVKSILQSLDICFPLIEEIIATGRIKKVPSGQVLIDKHSQSDEIPIVLEGILKISRHDKDDNAVFLYFLEEKEICAMSITCCLEGKKAAFHVTAEKDTLLWMVPMSRLDTWVATYPSFRKYIFASYQTRFDELLSTIDSVVFSKLDERLYNYLLDIKKATLNFNIHKTHEQIAQELNTSRVVISRLLKKLEKEGKIAQYRNRIEIL